MDRNAAGTTRTFEGHEPPPCPWGETDHLFKDRLVDEGNWQAFKIERAVYRFRQLPEAWANRFAQQHFPPSGFPVNRINTGGDSGVCGLGAGVTESLMRRRLNAQLGLEGHARPHEFEGKSCSFSAAMDWVAENLAVQVVKQHAPSALAWSIYQWATLPSVPPNTSKFYELYLSRRYKPDRVDEEDFDPVKGLSLEGEDVGLPREPGVPDALAGDTAGSAGEREVADEDELARYSVRD
jgi:hypothetical protein